MSADAMFLHCRACVDANEPDDLSVKVVPGWLVIECCRHEPPMLAGRFAMDTSRFLSQPCGDPAHVHETEH